MNTPAADASALRNKCYKYENSANSYSYEDQDSGIFTPGSSYQSSFNSPDDPRWSNKIYSPCRHKIDFLRELGSNHNFSPVLSKIFDNLSDKDISAASQVSKCWNEIINSNLIAKKRLRLYLNSKKENLENLFENKRSDVSRPSELNSSNNSLRLFNDITNINLSQQKISQEQSENQMNQMKFNLFRQEGEKLVKGEYLSHCVRCGLPAKIHRENKKVGICVNAGCEYAFCTECFCSYKDSSHCCIKIPPTTPRSKRKFLVNTKSNKASLRRLLKY